MSDSARPAWPLGDSLAVGKRVLSEEAEALYAISARLDTTFESAVNALLHCQGRVIISGVGKSGHVGHKIAATLASTGTPSFFVHAAEAGHGDLGMITSSDVVIVLSYSGESDEVVNVSSFAKRFGALIIGMTRSASSSVGKLSDIHLDCSVSHEACPLGVAPTSSTTVQIALGDALAMATLARRGFTTEDFARTHPLGQLGRRYYLRVRDVMQSIREIPHAPSTTRLMDAIPAMALGKAGAILLLEGESLQGIFTDSDLRRLITESAGKFDAKLTEPVGRFMTAQPTSIDASQLASEALRVFDERRISRIVCIDQTKVVGLLSWQNLLQHKVA